MRTVSAALEAAQKSASAVPYLRVLISDRIGGVHRLAWTRLYTGAEADGYHAACAPGDGSLLRARVSGGRLYYQRVIAPGAGSDFSVWTDLGAVADGGVALCANGSRVLLFFVDSGGTQVKVRESADNGATLGAAVTAATGTSAVAWLAAGVKPNGDALVTYSVGANVLAARRLSGAWGAPVAWPNSAASIAGIGCTYNGDWNLAIAGTDAAGQSFLWTTLVGDGFSLPAGTWGVTLREVMRSSSGSSVAYRSPFVVHVDTYRLTFVEQFSGMTSYARPYHAHSPATADFAANLWREPVPFDLASHYGQSIAAGNSAVWLSTPYGVWSAPLEVTSMDVTPDVLECATRDAAFEGRLQVVLRNDDGRYSGPSALALGAEVRVGPGYQTSAGPDASDGPSYWIERIERRTGRGEGSVVITARNGWSLLDRLRARRSYEWVAGTASVLVILQTLFARAGLEFSAVGASSEAANLQPAFVIHPGEPALRAVRRLLAMVPDVVLLRREFAIMTEPLASQAASFAYGAAGYRILAGSYAEDSTPANRAQAFGPNVFGEAFDWPSVSAEYDRLVQAVDRSLTTAAQVQERAGAMLRQGHVGTATGEITAQVNCGLELWDVIEVTDALAGLSAAKKRVAWIELRYSTVRRPGYEQRITLSGA